MIVTMLSYSIGQLCPVPGVIIVVQTTYDLTNYEKQLMTDVPAQLRFAR